MMPRLKVIVADHEVVTQQDTTNFCNYIIRVVDDDASDDKFSFFTIEDRYSSLREFAAAVKRDIGSNNDSSFLFSFPKKKLWGNMEPQFIEQRKLQLQCFFNEFFALRPVYACPLVPAYLISKSTGAQSTKVIKNLFRGADF